MAYRIADYTAQTILVARRFPFYANRFNELNTVATLLNGDTTRHDATISTAPDGLRFAHHVNTQFTDAVLQVVNRGKGGNLTPAQMAGAISGGMSQIFPPTNTVAPLISGTGTVGQLLINNSPGTWVPAGATYARQWQRDAANIPGATANNYTLVAADSGHNIRIRVTATNPAGSNSAFSNQIACA